MKNPKLMFPLLLVIFLEGYVVLSAEMLAIRQSIPYVDTGTDTISIIIAAVLLPLAFGYYQGGRFKGYRIRRRLLNNLVVSAIILSIGLSHGFIAAYFTKLYAMGMDSRILLTAIYSIVFIAPPVYLLGQTVPLAVNYLPRQRLASLTGFVLFISTLGSFMGAVFCTLILMTTIGVYLTAVLSVAGLAVLIAILSRRILCWRVGAGIACTLLCLALSFPKTENIAFVLPLPSSAYTLQMPPEPNSFARHIEENLLVHARGRDILVIGEGGHYDAQNNHRYTFLNIPEAIPQDKTYDLVILQGFSGPAPDAAFLAKLKTALKPGGALLAGFYTSPNFASVETRQIDAILTGVFPNMNREMIGAYDGWSRDEGAKAIILYSYFHYDAPEGLYTDNLNRSYFDRNRIID